MLVFLVERGRFLNIVEFAVDAHAGEARLLPFGQFLAIFTLAPAHYRRQQVKPRSLRQRHHPVDHLGDGLRRDRLAGRGRIGDADPRPEQAHVIVDLGDGGDGRARIARGRLLLDADRGREAVDMLDIRLLHHLQELARISRERFDVAALPFRIDGIEGERGLAGAGQAGDDDQPVAWQIHVHAFEIMFARAAHLYVGQHGIGSILIACRSRSGRCPARRNRLSLFDICSQRRLRNRSRACSWRRGRQDSDVRFLHFFLALLATFRYDNRDSSGWRPGKMDGGGGWPERG